jgi:hypothetical protein
MVANNYAGAAFASVRWGLANEAAAMDADGRLLARSRHALVPRPGPDPGHAPAVPRRARGGLAQNVLPLAGPPDERQELLDRVEYLRRYVKAINWEE